MIIRKKSLIISISILITLILLSLVSGILFNNKKTAKIDCEKFKSRYNNLDECGFIESDRTSTSHKIVGILKSKEVKNNIYNLELSTLDSNNNQLQLDIEIAPDPIKKWLKVLTPKNDFRIGLQIDPTSEETSQSLFNKLKVNEAIVVTVLTPAKPELERAKNQFGDLKTFSCVQHSVKIVNYLKKSSLLSRLLIELDKIVSNCNIGIVEVSQIK